MASQIIAFKNLFFIIIILTHKNLKYLEFIIYYLLKDSPDLE